MACCLFGADPSSEPMLDYYIAPLGINLSEIYIIFIQRNAIENGLWKMTNIL